MGCDLLFSYLLTGGDEHFYHFLNEFRKFSTVSLEIINFFLNLCTFCSVTSVKLIWILCDADKSKMRVNCYMDMNSTTSKLHMHFPQLLQLQKLKSPCISGTSSPTEIHDTD